MLVAYSDSEFGGDRDTRVSVYGYMVYYNGALISWKSKSGRGVTLSSTEAEYYACSEAVKELIFIQNVIKSMGLPLELPMIAKVDNIGAIFLANNHACGPRTKHIDIRTHFIREHIAEGRLKVEFVRTNDNKADINTKNLGEELFKKHSSDFLEEIPTEQILIGIEGILNQQKKKKKNKNKHRKRNQTKPKQNRKDVRNKRSALT